MAQRYDMGRLDAIERTSQGGLKVAAYVTRTGVFNYRRADGSVQRELRHPSEVFKPESLATMEDATLTNLHPGKVTPQNFKAVSIGHVRSAKPDGIHVAATVLVQDQKSIGEVSTGARVELSCGYDCDTVMQGGEYEGEKYDAMQTNIRYNHVAIGPKNWGRAGSSVKLRLDSEDAIIDGIALDSADSERNDTVEFETIDGIQYKVASPEHIQALRKRADGEKARADANASTAQSEKSRADGLQGKLDESAKQLAEANDPTRISKAVNERVAIQNKATTIVGKGEAKFDSLSNREIMVAAIMKRDSTFKCDDATSEDYLRGRFDMLVASTPVTAPTQIKKAISQAVPPEHQDQAEAPPTGPRSANQFNQPFALTK